MLEIGTAAFGSTYGALNTCVHFSDVEAIHDLAITSPLVIGYDSATAYAGSHATLAKLDLSRLSISTKYTFSTINSFSDLLAIVQKDLDSFKIKSFANIYIHEPLTCENTHNFSRWVLWIKSLKELGLCESSAVSLYSPISQLNFIVSIV